MNCPTCGHPLPDMETLPVIRTTRMHARLLAALRKSPHGTSFEDLCAAAWPNHKPSDVASTLRVHMSKLRHELKAVGWTIPHAVGGYGNRAEYRLEKIGSGPDA
jgi:DNA-binding response OmpR family regulator